MSEDPFELLGTRRGRHEPPTRPLQLTGADAQTVELALEAHGSGPVHAELVELLATDRFTSYEDERTVTLTDAQAALLRDTLDWAAQHLDHASLDASSGPSVRELSARVAATRRPAPHR